MSSVPRTDTSIMAATPPTRPRPSSRSGSTAALHRQVAGGIALGRGEGDVGRPHRDIDYCVFMSAIPPASGTTVTAWVAWSWSTWAPSWYWERSSVGLPLVRRRHCCCCRPARRPVPCRQRRSDQKLSQSSLFGSGEAEPNDVLVGPAALAAGFGETGLLIS